MTSKKKRLLILSLLLVAACAVVSSGYHLWLRRQQIHKLSIECPQAAQANDWRRLEQVSSEWLRAEPHSVHAKFWLGEALQSQGKFSEALGFLEQIGLQEPRGVDAAIRTMHIQLFVNHRPSAAMRIASDLLDSDPSLPDPIRVRIYFFAMTFQRDKLLQEITTAIRYRADLPEHYIHLMLLEDLSFRDGSAVVGRWLEHDKALVESMSDCLFIHSILADREAAINTGESHGRTLIAGLREKCRAKLEENGTNVAILELAIRLELEAGNHTMVEDLLQKVPESYVNDPVVWLHRGKLSLDRDDLADAESSLERALQLLPTGWKSRGYLATVKRLRGFAKDAEKLQEISAAGAHIVGACILLKSNREVPNSLLKEISAYAKKCHADSIAIAIDRRGL